MKTDFRQLEQVWERFGVDDPLYAVATREDKRGNRWAEDDFLATGEKDVSEYRRLIAEHTGRDAGNLGRVLDFGCGVGRLTRAWSVYADEVVGVDISAHMIERGRKFCALCANVEFELNKREDLSIFATDSFDFVFSHICLQHMEWTYAARYIREFCRVCRPGGLVAFQLPCAVKFPFKQRLKMGVLDKLPKGMGERYRQWKHGTPYSWDVVATPREKVEEVLRQKGFADVKAIKDRSAGAYTEGYIYIASTPKQED